MSELLMPFALKTLMMKATFLGEPIPGFLLGLATRNFELPPTLDTLREVELDPDENIGYSRVRVLPNDWVFSVNPLQVSTQVPQFRNTGSERWPTVRMWFMTDLEGKELLASADLRESRTLVQRDTLVIPIVMRMPG